jgi:hypothetical protein
VVPLRPFRRWAPPSHTADRECDDCWSFLRHLSACVGLGKVACAPTRKRCTSGAVGKRWAMAHQIQLKKRTRELCVHRELRRTIAKTIAGLVSCRTDDAHHLTNCRVSHRTMSISRPEPGHGPQMGAMFRSPSTRKQSYRKDLIESSCLPLKLVFYLIRRQTHSFCIVSRTDQRSIVLDLHLEGLLAHAIHGGLVAKLGPKAVAYSTVTPYLHEANLGTAEVTLDPEPSSPDLTPRIPTGFSWHPWKKRKAVFVRARTCPSHPCHTRYRL